MAYMYECTKLQNHIWGLHLEKKNGGIEKEKHFLHLDFLMDRGPSLIIYLRNLSEAVLGTKLKN